MKNQPIFFIALALLVVFGHVAAAQVQIGDDLKMNLNGVASFGYNGSYAEGSASEHGINGGGNATLTGSYYDPQFLTFEIQPFYNESRDNSSFKSIFNTSGVTASTALFSGSHFPGSITYSKVFNSEGQFGVPQLGTITTRGDSQNFGVSWGINYPDYPTLSVGYQNGSNDYSIFGSNEDGTSHIQGLNASSTYRVAGFILTGGVQHNNNDALTPGLLTGEGTQATSSSSTSYNLGVGHPLPLNGSLSLGASRSEVSSTFTTGSYSANIDTLSAGLGFQPTVNFNFGVNSQYTDNLGGTIYQSIFSSGVLIQPQSLQPYSTHSLDVNTHGTYQVRPLHLTFSANEDHRDQTVLGSPLTSDTVSEQVSYSNDLLGGTVNATANTNESFLSGTNSTTIGYLDTVSYTRDIGRWEIGASGNYSHNTQTILITYTSSGYGYSGSLGRKLGRYSHWGATATRTNSHFNSTGAENSSQSYSTGLSLKRFSVSGSYSKSNGDSILTSTGLAPVPLPGGIISPTSVILFGGHAYSLAAGTNPIRGLTLSISYSKALSNTLGAAANSRNNSEQVSAQLQYKVRQMWITGGYLRLTQGFSVTGGIPTQGSSFFIGISRWFNIF